MPCRALGGVSPSSHWSCTFGNKYRSLFRFARAGPGQYNRRSRTSRMYRSTLAISILCCTALFTGSAFTAPVVNDSNDLFDYLATTYPIKDWIANARFEYSRLEHAQPEHHPRFMIEVVNRWEESVEFVLDDDWRCVSARPRLSPVCLHSPVPDPCREMLASLVGKPALPARFGVREIWSIGFEAEPVLTGQQLLTP